MANKYDDKVEILFGDENSANAAQNAANDAWTPPEDSAPAIIEIDPGSAWTPDMAGSYSYKRTVSGGTQVPPYQSKPAPAPYQSTATMKEAERPDYTSELRKYEDSDTYLAYADAMNVIGEKLKGGSPEYLGQYDAKLLDAYNAIVNRDPFTYNAEEDPTWQNYKNRYTDLGQQAMRDTMGQAAHLTGGYGNTYAQRVGQQAYNAYMGELADRLPELEQQAYNRWRDQGNDLLQQYALLSDLRETDYSRWRDQVSDYNYNLQLYNAYQQDLYDRQATLQSLLNQEEGVYYDRQRDDLADYRYDEETGYNRYRDELADWRYEDESGYSRYRDRVSDARYEDELSYSRQRDAIADARYEDELRYERLRDQVADQRYAQEFAYQQQKDSQDYNLDLMKLQMSAMGSSGSSGSSGSYGGGSYGGSSYGGYSGYGDYYGGYTDYGGYGGYSDYGYSSSYVPYDPAALSGYSGSNPSGLSTEATQRMLNQLTGANLAVDGIWGSATQAAWEDYLRQEASANEYYQGLVDQYVTFR